MAAWVDRFGTNCTMVSAVVFTSAFVISVSAVDTAVSIDVQGYPHYYVAGRAFHDERLAKTYANVLHERSTHKLVTREAVPERRICKMRFRPPPRLMVNKKQKRAQKRKAYLQRLRTR